jgi:hypothetical protein
MTGQELLDIIHKRQEQDIEVPATTEEDTLLRINLINQAIINWENKVFTGSLWPALYASVTQNIATPVSNFLYPESLYLGSNRYKYVQAWESGQIIAETTGDKVYWITGGANNKVINVYPASVATATINYYKKATLYSESNLSSHIEMDNPNYAIEYVLSQLYAADGDFQNYNICNDRADEAMEAMVAGLDSIPAGESINIPDNNIGLGL